MKQRSGKNGTGVGVGMVSILMIFVVLCLTTFATLSLVSSRADLRLTERAATAISEYYAADSIAQEQLSELSEQLKIPESDWKNITLSVAELSYEVLEDSVSFHYQIPVNDRKNLCVTLLAPVNSSGSPVGELSITEWQVEPVNDETLSEDSVLNLAEQPMFD